MYLHFYTATFGRKKFLSSFCLEKDRIFGPPVALPNLNAAAAESESARDSDGRSIS